MKILLIEDDLALCAALTPVLERAGFPADICHDGADGLFLLEQAPYAACILDRMLPGMSGLEILRQARACGVETPVLMLTALGRISDRVDGLEAGADDYLTKPFDTRELTARLRALVRRPGTQPHPAGLVCGDFTLDPAEMTLSGPQTSVTLSRREYDLLETLCKGAGQLQTRTLLLGRVWGAGAEIEEANLDTYIHFVRRRLSHVGSRAKVVTVRGTGYRLEGFDA